MFTFENILMNHFNLKQMKNFVNMLTACVVLSFTACSSDDRNDNVTEPDVENLVFEKTVPMPLPKATQTNFNSPVIYGVASSSITVDRSGTIAKPWRVSVHLDLNSHYTRQYTIELFTPSGASIRLCERVGGSFQSGNILTFNSGAVSPFPQNVNVIPTGTYLPSSGLIGPHQNNLGTFLQDKDISGQWTIKVTDYEIVDEDFPEAEKLNNWKLEFAADALK